MKWVNLPLGFGILALIFIAAGYPLGTPTIVLLAINLCVGAIVNVYLRNLLDKQRAKILELNLMNDQTRRKSELLKQICQQRGILYTELKISDVEPRDLQGLPKAPIIDPHEK
jgi:hypothetical protein